LALYPTLQITFFDNLMFDFMPNINPVFLRNRYDNRFTYPRHRFYNLSSVTLYNYFLFSIFNSII
ncbi:MAG: hypothetical protein ACFFDN_32870, partial [Candidatus Hodarchaeota archaeon]